MSYYDDGTYANGADGSCQECGEPTDEEYHAYCSDCYREQMGWTPPARPAPGTPPPSFIEGLAEVREQLAALAKRVDQLERGRAS